MAELDKLKYENIMLKTTLNNIKVCIENIPETVNISNLDETVTEINKIYVLLCNVNNCLERFEESS